MSGLQLSWHLIPDGVSTIVVLEIKGEFAVDTADADKQAESVVVRLVSRITEESEERIRGELEADRWLGKSWAPDEPPAEDRHG
jgi:hypothetical protein